MAKIPRLHQGRMSLEDPKPPLVLFLCSAWLWRRGVGSGAQGWGQDESSSGGAVAPWGHHREAQGVLEIPAAPCGWGESEEQAVQAELG